MSVRVGLLGLQLGRVFLFCAEFSGLTPPRSNLALYTPTACLVAIRSESHTTRTHKAKQWATSSTHTNNQRSSATNGPYTRRYTAAIAVIHKKSQTKSDLQKSCILAHALRILTIYRKNANFSFQRLRKRIVLRSLSSCYPQTINNSLYYYIVFMQDCALILHC